MGIKGWSPFHPHHLPPFGIVRSGVLLSHDLCKISAPDLKIRRIPRFLRAPHVGGFPVGKNNNGDRR